MRKLSCWIRKNRKMVAFISILQCVFCSSFITSFAAEGDSVPTKIPASGTLDLAVLQQLWLQAAGMLIDTINIIASQPLLVMITVAMRLVGIGIGMFKRILA